MSEETAKFFEELDRRPYEPLLQGVYGTVRYELRDSAEPEQWLIKVDDGRVRVAKSTRQEAADAVVIAELAEFERSIRGEVNLITATMRGSVAIEGNMLLALMAERLMPGPPQARGPRFLRPGEQRERERRHRKPEWRESSA